MTSKPLIPLDIYWNQVSVKKHVPISFLVCIMCLTQQEERKRKELLRFFGFCAWSICIWVRYSDRSHRKKVSEDDDVPSVCISVSCQVSVPCLLLIDIGRLGDRDSRVTTWPGSDICMFISRYRVSDIVTSPASITILC